MKTLNPKIRNSIPTLMLQKVDGRCKSIHKKDELTVEELDVNVKTQIGVKDTKWPCNLANRVVPRVYSSLSIEERDFLFLGGF